MLLRALLAIVLFGISAPNAKADWPTACMASPTTVTTTAHIAVTFGGSGTYTIDYDLCEMIWAQEGNVLWPHFEVWFRVTNVSGSLGNITLTHDIPVAQGGQKLFGVVKWSGINLPAGYTNIIALGGATGISFQLVGDSVDELPLKYSHLTAGATIRLMGTAPWWVQN